MKTNQRIIIILLFLAAVGICAGAFFEVYMSGEGKQQLTDILGGILNSTDEGNSASLGECFINSLKSNILFLIAAYISPVIFITLPILPLFIMLKGISIGFSSAMTLEVIGIKGIAYLFIAVMPQNLIQIPVLCFLASMSLQAGAINGKAAIFPGNTGARRKRKALHFDARRYSYIYIIGAALIIISCLLEAFLLQIRL